ncbi:TRAP transporter small permease [Amorphus orientalis]|uniref:TRAP transporter small permease protein n=1 Tax=Amorphus orientalis TaxID=649198 RepID=A0AAE3VLY5_9HYPH|nr:TRAP transporter small permease [Amorphus orientalis]MDQ0314477.1 C4-dicarboxylate transporter DctQ subunit [Amorphus orientalis]
MTGASAPAERSPDAASGGVRTLLRILDKGLTAFEGVLLVVALSASVLFLVADIILRVAVNVALPWAAEATRYAIVWLVFIGGSRAALVGAHITIDALPEFLPTPAARLVTRIGLAISSAACAILAWYGIALVQRMTAFRQLSPSLEIPMWWVYLALPIGFALMTVRFAQAAIMPPEKHTGPAA